MQALKDQQFKHEDSAGGFAPSGNFAFFGDNTRQSRAKEFPINDSIQAFQRVAYFRKTGVAVLKIKQTDSIFAQHNKKAPRKALIYSFLAETQGFEPWIQVLPGCTLSRGVPSTTRPRLHHEERG